jgi:hypothetical protein
MFSLRFSLVWQCYLELKEICWKEFTRVMSVVSPAYKVEQSAIAFGGAIFCLLGGLAIYSRRFPWNTEKAQTRLVSYAHFVILVSGLALMIWSVDPRMFYGIYPMLFVIIVKDFITLLLISTALLYSQVIHCIVVESKMRSISPLVRNPWISVGIPMASLGIINISTTIISIQRNQEVYRAIFFGSIGIMMAVADIYSIVMFFVLQANQRSMQTIRSQSTIDAKQPSETKVKNNLKKSFILLAAIFILQFYMAIDVLRAKRTLVSSQIPDRTKYNLSMPILIYFIGLTVCVIHSWLPLRSGQKASTVEMRNSGNSNHKMTGKSSASGN